MNKVTQQDLLSHADYEQQRSSIRQQIIALKKRRRIAIGDLVTVIFENRDTIVYQIQEMLRTERIFDAGKIQDEIDVYNALLPEAEELSATLFIEITDSERIQELLDSFQEIDRSDTLAIRVGDQATYAEFEAGHSKEDKISAVHFIRFKTQSPFRQLLGNFDIPASLSITHPHYHAEVLVPKELREEWLKDLE
ncbi:MAG: fructose-bisphosphate aldolase [Nitrospirales bacterium]|nr:MAG: fructose-bisphosphate aldolase [Nitrospirales bacterium]